MPITDIVRIISNMAFEYVMLLVSLPAPGTVRSGVVNMSAIVFQVPLLGDASTPSTLHNN